MSEMLLKNVCKMYDKKQYAVRDFSLKIEDGEFVIFVGPSGCGKSTTLRMIAGLEEITSGELWIDHQLCNYVEPKDRDLSMVFQNYALYPQMTVYDNMAFALQIRKVPKKEIDKKVHEAASILGIEHLLKQRPGALSGGQKQRVAIGSAIMREPKAFLMDEPLSNLDAKLRAQMRVELAELHKRLGTTMIYVTHDQTEAMTLGTKIVVMKDGYIQQADTPKAIYENPANLFVAGFIGSPSMNFFEGKIRRTDKGADFELGSGAVLEIPEDKAFALANEYRNKSVVLGVRPEHFSTEVTVKDPKADYTKRTLSGKITTREMLGAESMFYLEEKFAGEFAARLPVETRGRIGDELSLFVDMNRAHFFDADTEKNIFYRGGQQ
ncbi:MAG TPA: sn-glycerol-3-phosphate ABC transporter ATP-binding protein UgpC [Candidatus Fusicatenibacter intestinigallinarum]|uniref:Sn-glycerol-3-phosphate ABC transporter ATP-binding protein UgpC n=1 Tax=Candidatus Fusicatenibacter intestinigallinarum TaxID=2838598 RepID=A0A9D2NBJ6_9FIRM|nr:sn-glycerol-3-phosphate ABC transporter ATP-binding protein UgpC [Candidatus Fusicatenibacter intestinigallinarum]